jgi:NADH-quinone oxidoreductase subunit G
VVSGSGAASEAVLRAAAAVARALWSARAGRPCRSQLSLTVPEANSMGLALLGAPGLEAALAALEGGGVETLLVLENDLYRRADAARLDAALARARSVVVLDGVRTRTAQRAHVVLPAASFAEAAGTLVNLEGRAQRYYQVLDPARAYQAQMPAAAGAIHAGWRWLRDLARAAGRSGLDWEDLNAAQRALGEALPALGAAGWGDAARRFEGLKIPRAPHRYSGRTAMTAHLDVSEPRPPRDPDSPLAFSMEGRFSAESPLIPFFWAPGWNSIQSVNKFQHEVGGPLRGGDPGTRLIEPAEVAAAPSRPHAPPAFRPRPQQWLVIPLHHVFGSEELSALGPAIAERAPAPYVALGADDAAALGVAAGDIVELRGLVPALRLPVELRPDLPRGVAGLPAGLEDLPFVALPQWAQVARAAP